MKSQKFRIPRKLKKKLKKGIWFYKPDQHGNSMYATPGTSEDDFIAFKKGEIQNLFDSHGKREEQDELNQKLDKETYVSDEVLKSYVNNIFRKDFRNAALEVLLQAKQKPHTVKAYFNFVNAYQLNEQGDESYGNICCLTIDYAKKLIAN